MFPNAIWSACWAGKYLMQNTKNKIYFPQFQSDEKDTLTGLYLNIYHNFWTLKSVIKNKLISILQGQKLVKFENNNDIYNIIDLSID